MDWLVKGRDAPTREKITAAAATRYVAIILSNKMVASLASPVRLALGRNASRRALGDARVNVQPSSPDNGVLAAYFGPIGDLGELASRLWATAGVVVHGLLVPALVRGIPVGRDEQVLQRRYDD